MIKSPVEGSPNKVCMYVCMYVLQYIQLLANNCLSIVIINFFKCMIHKTSNCLYL